MAWGAAVLMMAPSALGAAGDNTEPLGPSSRRTGLAVSEIMYHPTNRTDGLKVEFVELYNSNPWPEDISGYRLGGSVVYTNPPNTIIPGNGFLVLARNATNLMAAYSISNVLGPWLGGLPNDAGSVMLLSPAGAILLEVHYSDKPPWPASADGAGNSLVLARPSYGERDTRSWQASARPGGSPGGREPTLTEPLSGVMINELLAFPTGTNPAFVEIYNHRGQQTDLSGCVLRTNATSGNAFVLPAGTIIPAAGFVSFDAEQLGFTLAPGGGKLLLFNAGGARVLDAVKYEGQAPGIALGRFPDGGSDFRSLTQPTPGARNARPELGDVLINELIFDADGGNAVELFNRSTNDIEIAGWAFIDGLSYKMPTHTLIFAGGYLVIGNGGNPIPGAAFLPGLRGQLSTSGERIALGRPVSLVETNASTGNATTNTYFVPVDEVIYGAGDRLGTWRDYRSPSLERTDLRADARVPEVWADSAVTDGGNWVTVEQTGVVDLGVGPCDALQIMLLGPGEALVDNVEVVAGDGANRVLNGNFENGLSGWLTQGTHERTTVENGASVDGSTALHLRATGRGDPGPNGLRTALTSPLLPGTTATIRAQVRSLRGNPEILLRLKGSYLEAFATLPYRDGGTPGYRNSRWTANTGPQFYDTTHRPILPGAGEAVTVTARVDDPDGITDVALWYRLDPTTNWFRVTMHDDGAGGDEVAGDAVFTGQIPGQSAGTLVAFYLEARDGFEPSAASRYPQDAPGRECLVRFGEVDYPNAFGAYRFWMTQAARDRWASREKLSNDPAPIKTHVAQRRAFLQAQLAGLAPGWAITAPANTFTVTDSNYLILSGTAPLNTRVITINGTNFQVNWSSISNWSMGFALRTGTNQLIVQALDRLGNAIAGTSNRLTVVCNGLAAPPFGNLVINEVFSYLNTPFSDFIEIHNRSETTAYDLGGATVEGSSGPLPVSFYFLPGTVIRPGEFLVIVKSRSAYCRVFGAQARMAGEYYGFLVDPLDGRPIFPYGLSFSVGGVNFAFSGGYPWPDAQPGRSLQLIDPAQDSSRPGNWAVDPDAPPTPGAENSLRDDLPSFPFLTVNEILPWNVTNITDHAGQPDPWIELYNAEAQALDLGGFQLSDNYQEPTRWRFPAGSMAAAGGFPLVWLDGEAQQTTANEWHAGFRATTNYGYVALTRHVEARHTWDLFVDWLHYGQSVFVQPDRSYGANATGSHTDEGYLLDYPTPGAPNVYTPKTERTVLINEWMASNTRYPDPADGQFDDWFELRNPTPVGIDLTGFSLTDNLLLTNQFVVPSGYIVPPNGFLLVWADNQPDESRPGGDLHVNFKLAKSGDSIALFRPDGTLADMVRFGQQTNDVSQGRCPHGLVFFSQPTPRLPNLCPEVALPPFALQIAMDPGTAVIWYPMEYHTAVIQCSDELGRGNWVDLPEHYPLTFYVPSAPFIYFYDLTIQAGRQRFYRARVNE